MKRLPDQQWDDTSEEPAEPGERASGAGPITPRSSGVWESEARRRHDRDHALVEITTGPTTQEPCRTFAELYARHASKVWTLILHIGVDESDASDVFQRIFAEVFTWTRARGQVPEAPLLFTMAQRQSIDHVRERERRRQTFDGEAETDTVPSSKPDPEQQLGRAQAWHRVEAILARMSPDAAQVFRLLDIEELPRKEVALKLGRPVDRLDVQLHRARTAFWDLAGRLYNVKQGGSR